MTDSQKKACFVLSSIGADKSPERLAADKVLKHLIRKALGTEYLVSRADDDRNPGAISPSMIASILGADLIVADLSDQNPNVFYELAIAHGYRKPTVHIQRVGESIPFDVKDMRVVRYDITDPDNLEAAQKLLEDYAAFAVTQPEKVETPLSAGAEFQSVTSSVDPVAESNVLILDAIENLRHDVVGSSGRTTRVTATSSAKVAELRADRLALRGIINAVAAAGRLAPADLVATITPSTSQVFDRWVKAHHASITGVDLDVDAPPEELFDNAAFDAMVADASE